MIRHEQIGDCSLYLGDCLDILSGMDRVEAVVTDPPYLLTSGGNTTGEVSGKLSKEFYDNKGEIVACNIDWPDFMPVIYGALMDNAHAYIMANNMHVQNMLNSAEDAGFRFHNLLAWDKGTATPNRWYMKNLEYTGFFFKGKAFHINDCGSKQLHKIPNILNAEHPTEKPAELMRVYIENSTQPQETVLDPFMGSGTTGVACAKLDRRFIGIEIEEKFFDLACKRIEEAYKEPDMFIERPAELKQEAMI